MIKRPILLHIIFLMFGILFGYGLNDLGMSIIVVIIVFMTLLLSQRKMKKTNSSSEIKFLLWGGFVFFVIGIFQFTVLNRSYEDKFNNYNKKDIEVYGFVNSQGEEKEKSQSFIFNVEKIKDQGYVEGREILDKGKIILYVSNDGKRMNIEYGQRLWVKGSFEKPRPRSNPDGFDYSLYLKSTGISGTLFSKTYDVKFLDGNHGSYIFKLGYTIRNYIVAIVEKNFSPEQAGLLCGVLIGYTDGLSKPIQQAFSSAGLSHIMAVSGANVVFIILPFVYLFKLLGLRRLYSNIILIAILSLFITITGFQPSVLRAVLMADIVLIGQILKRESDFFSGIAFAAMLLLIYNPFTIFDAGFLLSFGATISLVMFYTPIKALVRPKYLPEIFKDILAGTIAAQIGVLPVTLVYFNTLGIISIITNILVVPLTGLITILGFLLIFISKIAFIETFLASFINLLLTFILIVTKIAGNFEYSVLHVATPSIIMVVFYLAFVITLYVRPTIIQTYKYKIIIGLLLYSLVSFSITIFFGKLEIVYLDVGQGDATFVRTATGRTILIDGGGLVGGGESDKGETVVMPFLYKYGGGSLDLMISTHPDADHSAGLMTVLKKYNVKSFLAPYEAKEYVNIDKLLLEKNVKKKIVNQGENIKVDAQTSIEFFNPLKNEGVADSGSQDNWINGKSICFKLKYKNNSFLFCGDIPEETETMLLKKKLDLKSDIIKAAHHGAKSSTSQNFIDVASPKVAIISTGKNMYGHPSPETIERLKNSQVQILRTDYNGAICLYSDGDKIQINKIIP